MRWYHKVKSFLFRDCGSENNPAVQPYWNDSRAFLDTQPQPALSTSALDRRAIRLRRD